MIDSKVMRIAALGVFCTAAVVLGVNFTWNSNNSGDWDQEARWDRDGYWCYDSPDCYPHTTNDDATVARDVTVDMTTEEIDTLTISNTTGSDGGPDFDAEGSLKTLTCRVVVINGGSNVDTHTTVVDYGKIITN